MVDLHYIIQIAIRWTDSHLHRFIILVGINNCLKL
ncbi:IS1096 element passenger TnpR family protein [Nostoc sp. UIC 10890]